MQYAILIHETAEDFARRSDPAFMGAWTAYSRAIREAGIVRGGAGLEPPETATSLSLRGGQRHVQDGPMAETKEHLGGFFLIEVADLDAALDWAARAPAASYARVEVRPLLPPPPGTAG
jgi:hypothetical protein